VKRRAVIFLSILPFASKTLAADFDDGLKAFQAHRFDQAKAIWTPLALSGDRRSQFRLGMISLTGVDGAFDLKEAMKWLHLAAKQKHAEAAFQLGRIYEDGQGLGKKMPEAAIGYFKIAGNEGHATALLRLSVIYSRGTGVGQDKKQANTFLKAAAEAGDLRAQTSYAMALCENSDNEEAISFAYSWFTVAAENHPLDDPREKEAVLAFRSMFTSSLGPKQRVEAERLARQMLKKHPRFIPESY
jgi:uncharacterized protein